MQIASGTYAGDAGTVTITAGWQPDVLIIKGGAQFAVGWISPMAAASYKSLATAGAIVTSGGPTITSTGATIPNGVANLNTVGNTYYWLAFRDNGAGDFGVFTYSNDNTDDRTIAITGLGANTPTFVLLFSNLAQQAICRFRENSGDSSQTTTAGTVTDRIQAVGAGSIQVGNNGAVNGPTASTFYGFAMCNSSIFYAFATAYTGTGSAHDETDGSAGMTGDHAWVKGISSATSLVQKHASETGANSTRWDANAESAVNITALVANGVSIGTVAPVNTSAATYTVALLKNGTSGTSVVPATWAQYRRRRAA